MPNSLLQFDFLKKTFLDSNSKIRVSGMCSIHHLNVKCTLVIVLEFDFSQTSFYKLRVCFSFFSFSVKFLTSPNDMIHEDNIHKGNHQISFN